MRKKSFLFFLRVFNDVDHSVPIIWKLRKKGHIVDIIFLDKNMNLDMNADARFQFLRSSTGDCGQYYYALKEGPIRFPNRSMTMSRNPWWARVKREFFKFLQKSIYTEQWACRVLKLMRPQVLIFDTFQPDNSTLEGKFFNAAEKLKIPVVGIPHGVNIFTNHDSKKVYRDKIGQAGGYRVSGMERFAEIIEQNPDQIQDRWEPLGVNSSQIKVLGSARYCPEWYNIYKSLWTKFTPRYRPRHDQIKVVFFLPRFDTNVDSEATFQLIDALSNENQIYLVTKDHTREGAGSLPIFLREKFDAKINTQYITNDESQSIKNWIRNLGKNKKLVLASSTALVGWADIVINFGSSVAIDALHEGKLLVNPIYLHDNETIFEAHDAGIVCKNHDEVMRVIRDICQNGLQIPYDPKGFFEKVVYGGRTEHDVLSSYCENIEMHGSATVTA